MTKCIAFHSYKGGTGKTTIGANFAASLTKEGYKVSLIDLDVYAPSLQSYFDVEPEKSINDYLYSNAEVEDVMVDMTSLVNNSFSSMPVGLVNERKPLGLSGHLKLQEVVGSKETLIGKPLCTT